MDDYRHAAPVDLPPYADWHHGRWGAAQIAHSHRVAEMVDEHRAAWAIIEDWPGKPGQIIRSPDASLTCRHKSMMNLQKAQKCDIELADPEAIATNHIAKRIRHLLDENLVYPDAHGWRALATAISGKLGIPLAKIVLDGRALIAATGQPSLAKDVKQRHFEVWSDLEWMRLAIYLAIHHTDELKIKTISDHVRSRDLVGELCGTESLKSYSQNIAIDDAMFSADQNGKAISEYEAHRAACLKINAINGAMVAPLKPDSVKKARSKAKRLRAIAIPKSPAVSAGFLTHALIFASNPADVLTLPLEIRETVHASKMHNYISRIAEKLSCGI